MKNLIYKVYVKLFYIGLLVLFIIVSSPSMRGILEFIVIYILRNVDQPSIEFNPSGFKLEEDKILK